MRHFYLSLNSFKEIFFSNNGFCNNQSMLFIIVIPNLIFESVSILIEQRESDNNRIRWSVFVWTFACVISDRGNSTWTGKNRKNWNCCQQPRSRKKTSDGRTTHFSSLEILNKKCLIFRHWKSNNFETLCLWIFGCLSS